MPQTLTSRDRAILTDNRNVIAQVGRALVGDVSTMLSEVVTEGEATVIDNMYLIFFSLTQILFGSELRKYKFVHDAF